MRLTRESLQAKYKIRCRSIFLKEVFEICNHKSLVKEFLTDYIEVLIIGEKMQNQSDMPIPEQNEV